jgi:D-alanine-D-alanine ligase-like ATP-grasp enzyme
MSIDTYQIMGCSDYGQVKVKVDSHGNPYVIDFIPTPSLAPDGLMATLAEVAHMPYPQLIQTILRLAIARYDSKPSFHHLRGGII